MNCSNALMNLNFNRFLVDKDVALFTPLSIPFVTNRDLLPCIMLRGLAPKAAVSCFFAHMRKSMLEIIL